MANLTKALKKEHKAEKALATLRAKAKEAGAQMVNKGAIIGGGAVAGAVDGKFGQYNLLGIPINVVVGVGALGAGLMGWIGKESDVVGNLGAGFLAYEAGKATKGLVTK